MRALPSLFRFVLLLATAGIAAAMSVRPPEFAELVGKADAVVRGEVTAVRCEWRGAGESRRIVTLVTVAVQRRLVGETAPTVELEFLGGRVGAHELTVPGQPQFRMGDRDILFVQGNGRQMCPLVHAMFGRYPVTAGAAGEAPTVARIDGVPLAAVADVAQPLAAPGVAAPLRALKRGAALSVEAFEAEIIAQAQALGRPLAR